MIISRSSKVLVLCLIASLAACGGGTSQSLPSAAQQTGPQSRVPAKAAGRDLLYVSYDNPWSNAFHVLVYSYPGEKQLQDLQTAETPAGMCADAAGDVWITYSPPTPQLVEYAHGGANPIATLSFPGQHPNGCSIDPNSGNMAVTNLFGPNSVAGSVEIYQKAQGTPTDYPIASMYIVDKCGYDNAGNLFVDGQTYQGFFQFAELPKGAKKFKPITLSQTINYPGGVRWDGRFLAVGEQGDYPYTPIQPAIYRFTIKGNKGRKVGTTQFVAATREFDFWIQSGKVILPDPQDEAPGDSGAVLVYDYPKGGELTSQIPGNVPYGAVVSVGPAR
jgi:hypothetical protein